MSHGLKLFSSALLFSFAGLLAGCTDECSKASDCAHNEVCYKAVCTPALRSNVTCQDDEECNGGDPTGSRLCVAGRCIIDDSKYRAPKTDSGIMMLPDGGANPDAGPTD